MRLVNRPNFGLLLDAIHFFCSGATLHELAAADPALIRCTRLRDTPSGEPGDVSMTEAMFARRTSGEGELPLAAFVAALPKDIPRGLVIPNLAAARAGKTDHERLGKAVAAARALSS